MSSDDNQVDVEIPPYYCKKCGHHHFMPCIKRLHLKYAGAKLFTGSDSKPLEPAKWGGNTWDDGTWRN